MQSVLLLVLHGASKKQTGTIDYEKSKHSVDILLRITIMKIKFYKNLANVTFEMSNVKKIPILLLILQRFRKKYGLNGLKGILKQLLKKCGNCTIQTPLN